MTAISIKQLLEAGVHFGHQTRRWNPKMREYIFGERNGIYIIDLQKTIKLFKGAIEFVSDLAAQGKAVLFVGTKRQAQEVIQEEAERCKMYYVNNRWLGGLLTNFSTIQNSIKRYRELESMRDDGFHEKVSKKEIARLERERKKLEKNLRGIRNMDRLPDAVFVVDASREAIAVQEASKLGIPIIAIVDTNCDPDQIDYVIPGNDDALRAVRLFASTIADAIVAGSSVYQAKVEAETNEAQEQAEKEAAARRAAKEAKEAAKQLQATRQLQQEEAQPAKSADSTPQKLTKEKPEKPQRKKKVTRRKAVTTPPKAKAKSDQEKIPQAAGDSDKVAVSEPTPAESQDKEPKSDQEKIPQAAGDSDKVAVSEPTPAESQDKEPESDQEKIPQAAGDSDKVAVSEPTPAESQDDQEKIPQAAGDSDKVAVSEPTPAESQDKEKVETGS